MAQRLYPRLLLEQEIKEKKNNIGASLMGSSSLWLGGAPMAERQAAPAGIDCAGRRYQWQSVSIGRPVEQALAQNQ
ncbi:hypothetical protein HPB50_016650 [Hyalomma asiaticum]|uniref:Uncharacterized protein n=1 Tax=Hyalomma asiaticum TaxID=266040 RepID=A0ACB7TQ71_HYAAI|nr:hypothetical protein HPB50_016650 [Hyalomma asiaticum]